MKCDQQYDAELARKSDKRTEGFRCVGKVPSGAARTQRSGENTTQRTKGIERVGRGHEGPTGKSEDRQRASDAAEEEPSVACMKGLRAQEGDTKGPRRSIR